MTLIRTPDDLKHFIKGVSGINLDDGEQESNMDETSDYIEDIFQHKEHNSVRSVFNALRMFVNDELNELDCAIKTAHYILQGDSPFAIVAYNSWENSIVKTHFVGEIP